jgi:hypothetical protein
MGISRKVQIPPNVGSRGMPDGSRIAFPKFSAKYHRGLKALHSDIARAIACLAPDYTANFPQSLL